MADGPVSRSTPGILRARVAADRFQVVREAPPPDLAPLVEYFWLLTWDLRGREPHRQQVLTHPSVHLTFISDGRARITGIQRGEFTEEISGLGRVVGVRFRPGGFRPFLTAPVATLTDRFLAIEEVFGQPARAEADAIIAEPDIRVALESVVRFLRDRAPAPDPTIDEVAGLVERISSDPSMLRVAELAELTGMSARRLQRLFAEYVGAGPKWVIRRSRMQEAAGRAAMPDQNWAALAADLGYADQAHFTRDFTAAVGTPPAQYARECAI